jgi:hypothetical protein
MTDQYQTSDHPTRPEPGCTDADQRPPDEANVHGPDGENQAGETSSRPREYVGPKGPDPVRYGDWEKQGRCIDF